MHGRRNSTVAVPSHHLRNLPGLPLFVYSERSTCGRRSGANSFARAMACAWWAGLRMLSRHLSFGLPTLSGLSSLRNTHCRQPYSTFLRSRLLRAKSYSLSAFADDLARIRSTRQHGSPIDSRRRKRKRGNFRLARARFSKTETLPKWVSSIRLQGVVHWDSGGTPGTEHAFK